MTDHPVTGFSPEQQELWQRVNDLWSLSLERNAEQIRSTLHPQYVGWDMNQPTTHDRETAIQSVLGDAPAVTGYELVPLSVQVYDHTVGVVHYMYSASVTPKNAAPLKVTGKWSEVYLRQDSQWVMVSVSGRPESPTEDSNAVEQLAAEAQPIVPGTAGKLRLPVFYGLRPPAAPELKRWASQMLPGPFLLLSIALGVILMWPLGLLFDYFGLPMFHSWGLAHGSFVIAWPALSVISYAAIWVATRRSKWARLGRTDA